ncbi:MAG: hypothetical protein A3C80_01265 [Candidatus Ryanbacteria bacterium RIFCSPHIGHO2_02_FULL_45_43]|uniref:General secretion pathway GspH domain-containing protein n=1 Tax=Candidatus Ryanbacteria bacterium RIFCSPHIGHO2_01_45_13 TaxID=1802112 RepID=A0A1G2FYN9_9BACT|nr:MAG: hypothetical protein A2718_03495 [Candidatus Ryanbacteria bacterium RIFCSPHIGHO2_01_FULL_44_130]OGZ42852.1 MAG: hypothetical protein A2W41_01880 [Candidatus Ryanbacteria bacterium RIFCSPHIGHO2_01_45_13]OGZ48154.1 MAG: hypothetical protein A3C80_01265 [Candidatus Ryanbacteria bacterium RIFCSPHIGHO2_02_FULL_45_43]OGZ49801.1 MAG: hypothetical protein A3E55_01090 [Candidatus Ryanbacteria bacterium RIFCSPHIGHO2_12_FULL_44_20]OGZ51228.1 MAG: hypothetical protein A3A17_04300 [Candidatus Ryanba
MSKGFSLSELIIVIGILLIVGVTVIPVYSNIFVLSQLDESAVAVLQALRTAKTYAIYRKNNAAYGVKFISPTLTMYQGLSYLSRDSTKDRVIELEDVIAVTTTFADDDVHFETTSGMTSGGIITLLHQSGASQTISVSAQGIAQIE